MCVSYLSFLFISVCLFCEDYCDGFVYGKDNIFNASFCESNCTGTTHTLCEQPDHSLCKNYMRFALVPGGDFFDTLVNGHNGLRDRIADRMRIIDMLEITWDDDLALMADRHLQRCILPTQDPCARISRVFDANKVIDQFFQFDVSPAYIVQNSYSERAFFFPYKFIERVIRAWYFEKDDMRVPSNKKFDDLLVGILAGENNFTHIASPHIHRFGCAMSHSNGAYHLVCNYFPYYRTDSNSLHYIRGDPVSRCPAYFPLPDKLYTNLCTQNDDTYLAGNEVPKAFSTISLLFIAFLTNCKSKMSAL